MPYALRRATIAVVTLSVSYLTLAALAAATPSDGSNKGANQTGVYDPTKSTDSANGNGGGAATGRPDTGSVGSADTKNPSDTSAQHAQMTSGPKDTNSGYECDGNPGVGSGNPAHTACQPGETAPIEPGGGGGATEPPSGGGTSGTGGTGTGTGAVTSPAPATGASPTLSGVAPVAPAPATINVLGETLVRGSVVSAPAVVAAAPALAPAPALAGATAASPVAAPAADVAATSLPTTGGNAGRSLAVVAALLVAGGVCLRASRRTDLMTG